MRALTAVDPTSTLSRPTTTRYSAAVIEAEYMRSRSSGSLTRAGTAPSPQPKPRGDLRPTTSPEEIASKPGHGLEAKLGQRGDTLTYVRIHNDVVGGKS